MFEILKRKMAQQDLPFSPATIMIDFESAMLPTLRLQFPNSLIRGCNFHFAQAVWRTTQRLGLVRHFHDNQHIRRIIRSLMALPFVPRNWVRHQYRSVAAMRDADLPEVQELLKYFKDTWLDGQFPPQMWNVFSEEIRTNNQLEGWHNSFQQTVGKAHPNIYELVEALKSEQASTSLTMRSATQGAQPPTMRKKYRERNQSILQLKAEFEAGDRTLDEYFSAIRRHVGYKRD